MAELDYQLALLMQHKFEQEIKSSQNNLGSDFEYARTLQTQFHTEDEVEKSGQNLSYSNKKPNKPNASKSLVDPSWEVIDPTPDIHVLFVAFNKRFFWDKLLSVCVDWSKRMTTCAGICSYQGRGGMCRITLSEPLLKLRPRKDLVETLLHEMIHAYLFVTHNNKDRDGHGLEFQKHMFRINAESGTNITIYHNFHDEVRLYKQHWWKCNGPCQNWKPYYGFVKRAMNRAPGPNDRWWGEHSRSCGGKFVKVKEPEKTEKPKKEQTKGKTNTTNPDIRKFFPQSNLKTSGRGSVTSTVTSKNPNASTSATIGQVIPKAGNIYGFTNLNGNVSNLTSKDKNLVRTTSEGNVLNDSSIFNPPKDYSNVRNAWLNKFPTTTATSASSKRSLSSDFTPKEKLPKLSNKANCPICDKQFDMKEMDAHVDKCLEDKDSKSNNKNCIICYKDIPAVAFERHVQICAEKAFQGTDDVFEISSDNDVFEVSADDAVQECKNCEICKKSVSSDEYDQHIFECLTKMYDDKQEKCAKESVNCLACDKKILKEKLNEHLNECMNLSNIFDDSNLPEGCDLE